MPRWLRWAVTALGALLAMVGAALVLLLGPDSRFTTGPHPIETDGIAVATAPGSFAWSGLQVDILAEVPVNKPVFVGLGNDVDIDNYLADVQRLEASSLLTPHSFLPFGTPHQPELKAIDGKPRLPGAPTALDWWMADSAGLGGASITVTLPDETVSAVILSVGSSNLKGLEVSFAYGIKGGFWKGLGLLALGGGALWLVRVLGRDENSDSDDDADVVYVYVDDDGVEHELTAEEAAGFEIVDEHEEPSDDVVYVYLDDDGVEHELSAEEAAEYDLLDESDEDEADVAPAPDDSPAAESEPEVEPDASDADSAKVVYVVVDEDGVEHEVSEDELDAYELVDDEDDV